jgi:hypothetical protein
MMARYKSLVENVFLTIFTDSLNIFRFILRLGALMLAGGTKKLVKNPASASDNAVSETSKVPI